MKRILILCLALFMLAVPAFAADGEGMTFSASTLCTMVEATDRMPNTYEAWLKLDAGVAERGGVILGNYGGDKQCINFDIVEDGHPRLYCVQQNGMLRSYVFDEVDVRTGEFLHLAIVRDAKAKTVTCYVNGTAIQTLKDRLTTFVPATPFQLGGDLRIGNTDYFKGEIKSVALYGDARTAEEIAADMAAPAIGDSDLIAAYDLTVVADTLTDLSGNGLDVSVVGADVEVAVDIPDVPVIERPWYQMAAAPDQMPKTIEVTFKADAFAANNVLVSNQGTYHASIGVEINGSGFPCIYYVMPDGTSKSSTFSLAKVSAGEMVHLTIVRDTEAKKVYCYINGVLKDSLKCTAVDYVPAYPYGVGGDYRTGNDAYFRGDVLSVTMYADMRTAEEIAADVTAPDLTDESLIVSYDLTAWGADAIAPAGGADIALERKTLWLDAVEEPADYAYSFAVIGDTQYVTRDNPLQLIRLYDYVLDNVEAKKIAHVFGLGDITDENSDAEWKAASKQIGRMNGVVPYSLVRGNHDGGTRFNDLFGEGSEYAKQCVAVYRDAGGHANYTCTAHTFSAGQLDYLVVVLDHDPTTDMMEWADGVIAQYPNHNVIVTTHGYLDFNGERIQVDADQDIWENLCRKHANIVMMLCGHVDADSIVTRTDVGDHGNTVVQLLIDPQALDYKLGPTGMVAMFYLSEDGSQVTVRYYSPVQQKFYKDNNQFTFTLNTIPRAE